jgi:uncharacterized protein (DUF433 family)
MATQTAYQHIILNEASVPMIAGTTMKVIELVLDHKANGWNPEELQSEHPYLSLGQIYSALAYYWDHQRELDLDIERRMQQADELRKSLKPSPLVARLKDEGLI